MTSFLFKSGSNNQIIAIITVASMCDLLDAPMDGTRSPTDEKFPVADTLTFVCNSGFSLSGPGVLTCQPAGTWDIAAPTCGKSHNLIRKTLWMYLN